MFEINEEMTERECNECDNVKSDVEFRTWDGIDAAEWDIICESCLEKKEREIKCFWGLIAFMVIAVFVSLLMFGAAIMFM